MRVVFLDTTMDGSLVGGAQTFLHKILKGLNNRDVEVHFVTKGTLVSKTAINIEKSGAIFHNKLWPASSLVEEAALVFANWLNKLKPDVYIVSVSPDIGWVVLPYLSPDIATIAIGHNDSNTFYEPAKHYAPFLTKAIGVSTEICHNYINKSGIKKENVAWIPYGVESSPTEPHALYPAGANSLSLVYVGRLEDEQKRASDLIKIIKLLVKEKVDFNFKVIGDGPLFGKLKEELSAEISQGIVQLTGWLNSDELMQHLRNSDVFVLTSKYEGFCISLIEAMANGCCPLVTDIESGNKELVTNEKNGFVVPVGDIEGFAEKIKFLTVNPAKLFELRQNAWNSGREYSVERMVDSYYDCFEEAKIEAGKYPRRNDPEFPLMESCRSKYPKWLRRAKVFAKRIKNITGRNK